ncbi:MAG: PIN domain-containing protein [Melioribacteraceae bacterium]|nr:PIN domain-containing protein [Melioribacteraceae bacterium]MCF8396200.1 PIN domain-containing protein [Melioribacteraceae bacterium]MCF8420542.1 PIN domain-containing protein [Melioribacteraceae bacterium]
MKGKYLIDTVILIDHLNGIKKATEWLKKNKNSFISPITRAELLVGAEETEKHSIKLLLDSFETLSINNEIADLAAELRKKHRLKLPDAIQAAIAVINKVKLVTRNTKDFNKEMEFVKIPYKI